jgi:hypothetical protein
MTFISRIMRFLIWLLVISWSVRVLRRILAWMLRGAPGLDSSEAVGKAGRLVRDPLCGMHVAEALSIPLQNGDEVLQFCSTVCRDKYAGNALKIAANG